MSFSPIEILYQDLICNESFQYVLDTVSSALEEEKCERGISIRPSVGDHRLSTPRSSTISSHHCSAACESAPRLPLSCTSDGGLAQLIWRGVLNWVGTPKTTVSLKSRLPRRLEWPRRQSSQGTIWWWVPLHRWFHPSSRRMFWMALKPAPPPFVVFFTVSPASEPLGWWREPMFGVLFIVISAGSLGFVSFARILSWWNCTGSLMKLLSTFPLVEMGGFFSRVWILFEWPRQEPGFRKFCGQFSSICKLQVFMWMILNLSARITSFCIAAALNKG